MIKYIEKKIEHQRNLLKEIKGSFILDKEDTFAKKLEKKILLVQLPSQREEWIENFHLTRIQFESLKETLKKREEKIINLAIIELEEGITLDTSEEYYLFNIDTTYEEYSNFKIINEHILYGENKEWAILVSSEDCSILAGISDFIKSYKNIYKYWKNDLIKFKKISNYFNENYGSNWGDRVLNTILKEENLDFDERDFLCNN